MADSVYRSAKHIYLPPSDVPMEEFSASKLSQHSHCLRSNYTKNELWKDSHPTIHDKVWDVPSEGDWVEVKKYVHSERNQVQLFGYRTLQGKQDFEGWVGKVYCLESDNAVAMIQFYPYTLHKIARVPRFQFLKKKDSVGFAKMIEKFVHMDCPIEVAKLILQYTVTYKAAPGKSNFWKKAFTYSKWEFKQSDEAVVTAQVAVSRLKVLTCPLDKNPLFLDGFPITVLQTIYGFLKVHWPKDVGKRHVNKYKSWWEDGVSGGKIKVLDLHYPAFMTKIPPFLKMKGLDSYSKNYIQTVFDQNGKVVTDAVKRKLKKMRMEQIT